MPENLNIALVVGTRPNFIKAAPLWHALRKYQQVRVHLVHTGQHSEDSMSRVFLEELGLPKPDFFIPGKQQSIVKETARISLGLEPVFKQIEPDWVIVIGDVTSTLAATLAAKQLGFRVAHVEAGLRSGDRKMPEEMNRIIVDHLSDLLFASEGSGVENLEQEGIEGERIFFTGNVLIDALHDVLPQAKKINPEVVFEQKKLSAASRNFPGRIALCTFHRPSNVDTPSGLQKIVELLRAISKRLPVVFPIHPRTLCKLKQFGMETRLLGNPDIWALNPLGYTQMVALGLRAAFIVTDSGGIQEESTWLGVPCLTFRRTTERPATVEFGTNTVISDLKIQTVEQHIELLLAGNYKSGKIPPLWDGRAAHRIAQILISNPKKPETFGSKMWQPREN